MSSVESKSTLRIPFPAPAASRAFAEHVTLLARSLVAERVSHMIPPQNVLRYLHGESFSTTPDTKPGQFQEFTYPTSLDLSSIRESDASVLLSLTTEIAERAAKSQIKRVYEIAIEGADRAGNTATVTPGRPLVEHFVEMAERVNYSVGDDGKIHTPSFHFAPEMVERILPELKAQEAQYAERMQENHKRKTTEAMMRERARLARFRNE